MSVKKSILMAAVAAVSLAALTACSGPATPASPAETAGSQPSAANLELVTAGTLTVCSDVPYAPFEDFDTSTPSGFTGFDIDTVGEIAKRLDLELAVLDSEFDALQSGTALAAGQCDLAASAMTITDERKANLDFADPYYDSLQSLLVRTDSGITKLADLAGKRIGIQVGTTGKDYAQANAPADAELVEYASDGDLWPALQAGNVDAILQDQPVNHEHEVADATYKIVETYQTNEQYGFALAKDKAPNLLSAINEQLAAMRADGTYDTIYATYFG